MNNISNVLDGLKSAGNDGWNAIKTIAEFLNYLMHPGMIFRSLWNFIVLYSYWICLFVALISLVLYSLGFKRFAKYLPASVSIYVLIKMLAGVF
jgi:hypothetical protein